MLCEIPRLVDSFGRIHTYLRLSIAQRCNLKCSYCMPDGYDFKNSHDEDMNIQEIVQTSKFFVKHGVKKIRLTGGEPTLNPAISDIIHEIGKLKAYGLEDICITSNGIILHRVLTKFKSFGLNKVNISLDTLNPEKFEKITKFHGLKQVLKSIAVSSSLDFDSFKINCVIMKDFNLNELYDFIELTRTMKVEVRFIEYMPFAGNCWDKQKFISVSDLLEIVREKYKIMAVDVSDSNTSKVYKVDGFIGTFGVISSLSQPFCKGCNRLRVGPTGLLQLCLFGEANFSIRKMLHEKIPEKEMFYFIQQALLKKKYKHDGRDLFVDINSGLPMVSIGG